MQISEITRRDIVDSLLMRESPFYGRLGLMDFLKRVWNLSSMPSTDSRFENAEGDIWQHMINNDDWNHNYLLCTYLDLVNCDDQTFLRFLETCLHPLVLSDQKQVAELQSELNKLLLPDGFGLVASSQLSGRPIYKAVEVGAEKSRGIKDDAYEVVLSFAGEDRAYVEAVAEYLKNNGVRVFYDKYEEVSLWGKDLAEHLDRVYRGDARYCIMFISQNYADKIWTNHERQSALAKAIEEKVEYILPARFDDTKVPGIRPTLGYVDLRKKSPEQLSKMILQKLGRLSPEK